MLEACRVFDNYRQDQFIQYSYGQTYMDYLIVSLIDSHDNDSYDCDNIYDAEDLNSIEYDITDTRAASVMSVSDTRCSGIVNSPLCQDINYPDKVKNLRLSSSLALIGPLLIVILLTNIWKWLELLGSQAFLTINRLGSP